MGLFDKFKSVPATIDSEKEAVASLILAIIAADGDVSDEEITSVMSIANSKKLFKNDDYSKIHKRALEILRTYKGDLITMITEVGPKVSEDNRHGVFATIVDLAFADGTIADEEERVMEVSQKALSVSDADAELIIKVAIWKNGW